MKQEKIRLGRPPKDAECKLEQRSIRLLPRQWRKIEEAGMEALRAYLDRWRPSKNKAAGAIPVKQTFRFETPDDERTRQQLAAAARDKPKA